MWKKFAVQLPTAHGRQSDSYQPTGKLQCVVKKNRQRRYISNIIGIYIQRM